MGFVGIFIPIYLLELGNSVSTTIAWLLTHHLSLLAGAFLVIYVSNTIGLVRCWWVRISLVTILFTGLFLLPYYPSLLFILAIISGMESAFFWIPYNILTVRKTEEKTVGSSLAFMSNVGSFVGIFVPGVAAFIIIAYGFNLLFAVALLFIIFSIIPVLPLSHEKTDFKFSLPEIRSIVRRNKHFILPEILDNLSQDAGVIWTLFIFITALTVLDIGLLGVISGLLGIIITHITGSLIDKWDKKRLVRFGAVATTLTWLLSYVVAIYSPTQAILYIVTVLRGFSIGMFASSYGAIMFNRARSFDAQFLVLREVPTIFGRVIIFLITLFLISVDQFELSFLFVGLISLYFWFNNLDNLTKKPDSSVPHA